MQHDYAQNGDPERSWGATESVPILTEAANQFQSRTYKIFFPNDTFVSAIPMRRTGERKELEDRADRIGRHMSYQLGFQDRSYKQNKDALFLGVSVHGSFFTKTYFSVANKKWKVDNVRPTDLVVNYSVGPMRIEDCRRKTHVIYTSVGETEDLVHQGYLTEPAKPCEAKINETYNLVINDVSGLSEPSSNSKRDRAAILLEQHCYFDLDGSGEYRPYIATVDAASHRLLRLTIGYEAKPNGEPLDNYKQVQVFTHYKYQENPDGFYGLGLGHTLGDLNAAINIALRQTLDAATLANDGNMSGFVSERLGLEGDTIRAVLGKLRKVPDTVGDFKDAIMMMQFPGPNAALVQLMEVMDARATRLGAVTEATTGSIDKTIQPTTVLSQIEQALEQFSSVQMRLANSLSEELQKIYKINQKFLPLVEMFVVNGEPETVTRMDYADDMLIQPIFDPKYATQSQKLAKAQAELEGTMSNPVNQSRPMVIDAAYRRYFEALDVENIDELIPPQPMMENIDDQFMENAFFLMPKEARPLFDVFPEQNHQDHLMKLMDLQAFIAQNGVILTPDQQEDILKHQQKHMGYLYGQIRGVIPTQQVSTPPLGARQGEQVGNYETTGEIPTTAEELLPSLIASSLAGGGQAGSPGIPEQSAE